MANTKYVVHYHYLQNTVGIQVFPILCLVSLILANEKYRLTKSQLVIFLNLNITNMDLNYRVVW